MQFAAGRLRVLVGFSFSVSRKSRDAILYDKARAYAEKCLNERHPPNTFVRFGVKTVVAQDRLWRENGRLDSRTATLLAEREAVIRVLDGKSRSWSPGGHVKIPRWRWRLRPRLERSICEKNMVVKWW